MSFKSLGVHFGAIGFTEVSLGVAALANLLSTSMTTWLCGNLIDPFSGRALPGVQKTVSLNHDMFYVI